MWCSHLKLDCAALVFSNPIVEHCTGVRFAPYDMYYTGLRTHQRAAGLAEANDLWQQV